jgi:competence protein ComFC
VCEKCIKEINKFKSRFPYYTKIGHIKCVSPFIYDKIIKQAILTFKFKDAKYNAKYLAPYMVFEIRKHYRGIKFDYAAYIPSTQKKKRERGYNQAELLYNEIAPWINVPTNQHLLIKMQKTKDQKRLYYKERMMNLNEAFKVSDEYDVSGKTILIIDDVHTTGATIDAAAKTLYEAGAKEIYAVTFARVKR